MNSTCLPELYFLSLLPEKHNPKARILHWVKTGFKTLVSHSRVLAQVPTTLNDLPLQRQQGNQKMAQVPWLLPPTSGRDSDAVLSSCPDQTVSLLLSLCLSYCHSFFLHHSFKWMKQIFKKRNNQEWMCLNNILWVFIGMNSVEQER